jgi:DNA polymerase-3 subunit delta'
MAFADVLGHDRVKALLSGALREGRLPPALLLAGPEGVGKKLLALTVARGLLCEPSGGDPCERCAACRRAQRGLHPDLLIVEPATAAIKIEQVRDAVREIEGRPFEGRSRAVVFNGAHLMTEQAQNALLKSLEEPPSTSHVLLLTPSPQALLPTIRSRCQLLRLSPLPQGLLARHLEERLGLGPEEARLRAALAGGSLGAALAFESDAYRERRERLLALLERLPEHGPLERLEAAERLSEADDDAQATLLVLRTLLRDVAALRIAGSGAALNADVAERLAALARSPLGERAATLAEAVGESQEALSGNANRLLTFDLLMETLGA